MGIHTMASSTILEHLKTASDQVTAMQTNLRDKEATINAMQTNLRDKEATIDALKNQLEQARQNKEALGAQITELEVQISEAQNSGSNTGTLNPIDPSPLRKAWKAHQGCNSVTNLLGSEQLLTAEANHWENNEDSVPEHLKFLHAMALDCAKQLKMTRRRIESNDADACRTIDNLTNEIEKLKAKLAAEDPVSAAKIEDPEESVAPTSQRPKRRKLDVNDPTTYGYTKGDCVPYKGSLLNDNIKYGILVASPTNKMKQFKLQLDNGTEKSIRTSTLTRDYSHMIPNYGWESGDSSRASSPSPSPSPSPSRSYHDLEDDGHGWPEGCTSLTNYTEENGIGDHY